MPVAGAAALIPALGALALAGAAPATDPFATPAAAPHVAKRRPALSPAGGGSPFRVRGTGFAARERVRVTITPIGRAGVTRRVRAGASGAFVLAFPGIAACGGIHGSATGSAGSHASFQFSSVTCRPRRPGRAG